MKIALDKGFQFFLEQQQIDLASILEEAHIPNLLWREELFLTEQQYFDLQSALANYLSDEQILALSDIDKIQLFMPPFFAALSASHGLQAIHRFATYKALMGPIDMTIQSGDQTLSVTISPKSLPYQLTYFSVVNEVSLLLSILRKGTGRQVSPVRICQPYLVGEVIREDWQCPIVQSQQVSITFSLEDLELPFLTKNNTMWQMIQPELDRQLQVLHSDKAFINTVHETLQRLIVGGEATLDNLAKKLGLSARTLQRQLKDEQTTFKAELQAVQFRMAVGFAKNEKQSAEEIAYLLGYSEVSAFSRAFKKWTGMTLHQYLVSNTC